jgi:hypothetical protein
MAGLVPAIHALSRGTKNVDARDEPGHDDLWHIFISDSPGIGRDGLCVFEIQTM